MPERRVKKTMRTMIKTIANLSLPLLAAGVLLPATVAYAQHPAEPVETPPGLERLPGPVQDYIDYCSSIPLQVIDAKRLDPTGAVIERVHMVFARPNRVYLHSETMPTNGSGKASNIT